MSKAILFCLFANTQNNPFFYKNYHMMAQLIIQNRLNQDLSRFPEAADVVKIRRVSLDLISITEKQFWLIIHKTANTKIFSEFKTTDN